MKEFKIAVIPGDGIGPEVIGEGVKVLQEIEKNHDFHFIFDYFPWGCEYYLAHKEMMPENGIEKLSHYDAIYLGAVGFPGVPDHISLWGLLLKIRKSFNQYVNLRPVLLLSDSLSPLKKECHTNMTFVRENTEGEYAGSGAWLYKGTDREVVIQDAVFSRKTTEKTMRYAFELAKKQGKKLTSISKGNALNYSMVFWDEVFDGMKQEYPEVETDSLLVDAASMFMLTDPDRFGIIVTTNLFGDILTDLGAALTGGLGLAAGANVNPEREYPAMFEPIHGSAPDIAGRGIANPLASIWATSQMMEYFGYEKIAKQILASIQAVVQDGKVKTKDMGGQSTTEEMGKAVRTKIKEAASKERV